MLVLSRHKDESIVIDKNIVITVVEIRGDKVRLGINAPTQIPVHRQEVYEAIQRENSRGRGELETNLGWEFRKNLGNKDYMEAYKNILGGYRAGKKEASELLKGLEGTGSLTTEIKNNLEHYL